MGRGTQAEVDRSNPNNLGAHTVSETEVTPQVGTAKQLLMPQAKKRVARATRHQRQDRSGTGAWGPTPRALGRLAPH
eukprot:9003677-Pyramimonas_sp.AAC.1